jgi:hypothetical protein
MALASLLGIVSLAMHQDGASLLLAAIVVVSFALAWFRVRRET